MIKIVKDSIVKRKVRCITNGGYFQHKGFIDKTSSELLDINKTEDDVRQIILTYYPVKENKPILLLDRVDNYSTVKKLNNAINKALDWLSEACIEGFNININEDIYAIEVSDLRGNLLYVLKI